MEERSAIERSAVFEQQVQVADEHIDLLGHVSNVQYVSWVQDVARGHSEHVGYDHAAYVELGAVFVVRRHEIDYLRPAFAGDTLQLQTWVEGWRAATSVRHTVIQRPSDDCVIAKAATTWAFMALDGGRPRRIPDTLKEAFQP